MIVETVRIWKDDTSEEFEAKTAFFMKDVFNVEEYVYPDVFKNDHPKSFVHIKEIGSIIVLEDFETLKIKWAAFNKHGWLNHIVTQ